MLSEHSSVWIVVGGVLSWHKPIQLTISQRADTLAFPGFRKCPCCISLKAHIRAEGTGANPKVNSDSHKSISLTLIMRPVSDYLPHHDGCIPRTTSRSTIAITM